MKPLYRNIDTDIKIKLYANSAEEKDKKLYTNITNYEKFNKTRESWVLLVFFFWAVDDVLLVT